MVISTNNLKAVLGKFNLEKHIQKNSFITGLARIWCDLTNLILSKIDQENFRIAIEIPMDVKHTMKGNPCLFL